jgi:hypothetical protein
MPTRRGNIPLQNAGRSIQAAYRAVLKWGGQSGIARRQ